MAVNEGHHPIQHTYGISRKDCKGATPKPGCGLTAGSGMQLSMNLATVDRVALVHYVTRSREDFAMKQSRKGGVNGREGKTWSFFNTYERCAPLFVVCTGLWRQRSPF